MFDKTAIETALYGIVGFRQPFDPVYAILDANNLASRSGYFVNDNAYAKIAYIKNTQDYAEISDVDFNLFLKRQQEAAIASVMNEVFIQEDFRERNYLYQYAMNKVGTSELPDGFVGQRIQVNIENNIAFEIKNVLSDFSEAGTINLLLFSSEENTKTIQSKTLTITAERQVHELNWVVNNTQGIYKGEYYLGYIFTSGTTPKPYKREYNAASIISLYNDLFITRINVLGHTSETVLFDLQDIEGSSDYIGFNPDITVYDDFTDVIINSQQIFANAIHLTMTIRLMSLYAASLRSNKLERDSSRILLLVLQQIDGQNGEGSVNVRGFAPVLANELTRIRKHINKLIRGYIGTEPTVHTMT